MSIGLMPSAMVASAMRFAAGGVEQPAFQFDMLLFLVLFFDEVLVRRLILTQTFDGVGAQVNLQLCCNKM